MEIPQTPHNSEAENAAIGAALINPECLKLALLKPDDFYLTKNRMIWQVMTALQARKIPPDIITICEESERQNLTDIFGPADLVGLINNVPTSLHFEEYQATVLDYSNRRKLLTAANQIAVAAYDLTQPCQDSIPPLLQQAANGMTGAGGGSRHISEGLKDLYLNVEERYKNPCDIWGVPTGFFDLDGFTGGLQAGEVFYIAGQPGVGKSKLSFQIGLNAAIRGHGVVFYSLEMTELAVLRRLVSGQSNVRTRAMKSGKMTADDWDNFTNTIGDMESLPIWLVDTPMGLPELRADIFKRKLDGAELFVLDYMTLMTGFDRLNDLEKSARLSTGIKQICKEIKIAGVTVNAVTKDAMDDTVGTAVSSRQVRGSGTVIHDADLIAFLTKDPSAHNGKDSTLYLLTFTKTRDVEMGRRAIPLLGLNDYPVFKDVVLQSHSL